MVEIKHRIEIGLKSGLSLQNSEWKPIKKSCQQLCQGHKEYFFSPITFRFDMGGQQKKKSLKCDLCDFAFIRAGNLKAHLTTNTGKKIHLQTILQCISSGTSFEVALVN